MKKTLLLIAIGLTFVLLLVALIFGSQSIIENKAQLAFGQWLKKQEFKSSKGLYAKVPPETWGEITDLDTASKLLGFNLKLPTSPKATAAGAFKVFVPKGEAAYAKNNSTSPKPDKPIKPGASAHIYYPNGLVIQVSIRHP